MQTSVENTSAIGRKMRVSLPAETVESAVQEKLKRLAKQVKIQGFRKGKVPMKIVEQHYRGSATGEVLSDLIQSSMQEAFTKEDIVPAVRPDVEPEEYEVGNDFVYDLLFDVYPTFEKLDLNGVQVDKVESEISDADVEKVLESMRKQQISWEEVERASQEGDRVILDFNGTVDGEEFTGGSANDHAMVIGEGQMLADFEAGVTGMKAGDKKDIDVHFPEDYHADLGGKTAVFAIEVKTVSEPILPEVNEEFIQSFGVESGKLEDLNQEVRSNLEVNLENQLGSQLRQSVFDALLEQNKVEVPLKMVKEEAQRITQEQKNQMIQQGLDPKLLENFPQPEFEVLQPQAEKRVALGLLMMEVIQKNELQADEKRVDEKLEKMASSYEDPQELVQFYKNNEQALEQVKSLVLEEQVVDFLLSGADVKVEQKEASAIMSL